MEDEDFFSSCLPGSAIHEAGHIVVGLHYHVWPNFATLEPTEDCLARVNSPRIPYSLLETLPQDSPDTKQLIRQYAHHACAGAAAEIIREDEDLFDLFLIEDLLGEGDIKSRSESDYYHVFLCLNLLENDPEKVNEPFEEIWNETVDIFQSHWAAVEALAQALLERTRLEGDELLAIWEETEGK
jgi:hypothetical protein